MILAQTVLEKFHPKPSQPAFRRFFQDNFRPEVVSDVLSGGDVGQIGMDIAVKFGDSRPNRSRDT